jgi:hypothetical protein
MRTGIQRPDEFIPDRWSDDNQDKEKLKVFLYHSIKNLKLPFQLSFQTFFRSYLCLLRLVGEAVSDRL